jgi:hypothetical protein
MSLQSVSSGQEFLEIRRYSPRFLQGYRWAYLTAAAIAFAGAAVSLWASIPSVDGKAPTIAFRHDGDDFADPIHLSLF